MRYPDPGRADRAAEALRALPDAEAGKIREHPGMHSRELPKHELMEAENDALIALLEGFGVVVRQPDPLTDELVAANYGAQWLVNRYMQAYSRTFGEQRPAAVRYCYGNPDVRQLRRSAHVNLARPGCGEIMSYLNQVDALLHEARRLFAHAEHEAGNWPHCGHLLARALEHATCAVFTAWDEPHAPERKMHRFFDERLVPHVDPAMAALVRFVWAYEGQGRPDTAVEQLLAVCRGAIGYFADLAQGPPPTGWVPLPVPKPVAWQDLSDEERQFLQEALPAAAGWVPGVRLVLFGSRAAGVAGPGSGYDIFFIFPDQTADWQRPQSVGSVSSLAIARGIELSVESASDDEWLNPPEVSRPLIERVKATGIEVPWPEPDEQA